MHCTLGGDHERFYTLMWLDFREGGRPVRDDALNYWERMKHVERDAGGK